MHHCVYQVASSPFRVAHKSIIVPEYCRSMHFHECTTYDDPSSHEGQVPRRRLGVAVVNQSLGVSHHYRACMYTSMRPRCPDLLAQQTTLDDNVLRYRQQLIDNVRNVLTALRYDNKTVVKVPPTNATKTTTDWMI